jgi:putative transposase
MTAENRSQIIEMVKETVSQGASQEKACEILGVDARSVQRYKMGPESFDKRRGPKTRPCNKLSNFECEKIKSISLSPEFCDMSPHQIVPHLADKGEYVASESSFYRVLKQESLLNHRGKSKPRTVTRPRAFEATRPNELYSWDITYLLTRTRGLYFYLYLFLDIFSRKIVGAEVHERESAELSSQLLTDICKNENIQKDQLTTHADNGGPMKGSTMLVTMQRLGVMPSFSRPSVSDDNPYSESMFKTLKYCPQYPTEPFATIELARAWVEKFVLWYNTEHLHSGISFVTPESRHGGTDKQILLKRENVYAQAKEKNPNRWSGKTRNWKRIESVKLNWLKDSKESATPVNQSVAS